MVSSCICFLKFSHFLKDIVNPYFIKTLTVIVIYAQIVVFTNTTPQLTIDSRELRLFIIFSIITEKVKSPLAYHRGSQLYQNT